MGFLDRVIGAVNRVATPLDNLDETIGPSRHAKGDKVAREGEPRGSSSRAAPARRL